MKERKIKYIDKEKNGKKKDVKPKKNDWMKKNRKKKRVTINQKGGWKKKKQRKKMKKGQWMKEIINKSVRKEKGEGITTKKVEWGSERYF